MTIKRINLCFSIDDPKQKAVYDFLMKAGKNKTKTVVNCVGKAVLEEAKDRKEQNLLANRLVEAVSNREGSRSDLKQVLSVLERIEKKLSDPQPKPDDKIQKPESEKYSSDAGISDMDEDLFSAIASMFK